MTSGIENLGDRSHIGSTVIAGNEVRIIVFCVLGHSGCTKSSRNDLRDREGTRICHASFGLQDLGTFSFDQSVIAGQSIRFTRFPHIHVLNALTTAGISQSENSISIQPLFAIVLKLPEIGLGLFEQDRWIGFEVGRVILVRVVRIKLSL